MLVAVIDSNEIQALSDEYPDELRSASHVCRKRERVLERADSLLKLSITVVHPDRSAAPFDLVWLTWSWMDGHDTETLLSLRGGRTP